MRVLVLGGSGMLGHKLWQRLREKHDTYITLRRPRSSYASCALFDATRTIDTIDASNASDLDRVFEWARPDLVINAIGLVKQLQRTVRTAEYVRTNALLPHELEARCIRTGARLIHISTDCVFSGAKGDYTEEDNPDPVDDYGRTKLLGEVNGPSCLTIRTSMIGRELEGHAGLVEWFRSQAGTSVFGYREAVFSGLSTISLAALLEDIAENHPTLNGVWHVSADRITKYDLLILLNEQFRLGVTIEAETRTKCDRSLDSRRFRERTGFRPKTWAAMIQGIVEDPTPYDLWNPA